MRVFNAFFLVVAVLFAGASGRAENAGGSGVSSLTTQVERNTSGASRILGGIELRPGVSPGSGDSYSNNAAELGYRFSAGREISYKQEFRNNLYRAADPGLGLVGTDGYFKGVFDNLWTRGRVAFNYENRIFLPTNPDQRAAGMVTALANNLKLKFDLGHGLWFTVSENPVLYVFTRAGAGTTANPVFQNQFTLLVEGEWFNAKLKASLPLMLFQTRNAQFAGGTASDSWTHLVWFYPEATYGVAPGARLGAAFMSGNLVRADFTGFDFARGLREGTVQGILKLEI